MKYAPQITGIQTVGEFRSRLAAAAHDAGRRVVTDPTPLVAVIQHDRLIAVCPHCGAGIAIDPAWQGAGCMDIAAECYRWYPRVDIPEDLAEIESVLKERPRAINRNWEPGETVALLRAENDVRLRAPRVIRNLLEGGDQ